VETKKGYQYSYRGKVVEPDEFLAATRRSRDAKLNMVLGGPGDAVCVFDSDDELLEWSKTTPVASFVEESQRYIKHLQQSQDNAGAEKSLQHEVRRGIEQAHQFGREAKLDLKRREDQMALLKIIDERVRPGDAALAWEHIQYGGDVLPISGGIPNLAWVEGFLGRNWSNLISSFAVGAGWVTLSDLTWFRGSKLHCWPYRVEPDLTQVFTAAGVPWNDLASSIVASI
jgi:hypothetical protein